MRQKYTFHVLGPRGSNACQATAAYTAAATGTVDLRLIEHHANYAALAALDKEADSGACALVPIENSSEGPVGETLRFWRDALADSLREPVNFRVVDELRQPISHCLARRPGAEFSTVISHQQAIGQCSRFLETRGYPTEARPSTAAAAREVSESREPIAALCSEFAARCYGLEVVAESVQDDSRNETRFHVLGRSPTPRPTGRDRLALILELENSPGAAHYASGMFGAHGVNISMQQSVSFGLGAHGSNRYAHYFEAECHEADERGVKVLACLRTLAVGGRLIVLGSYPQAPAPERRGGAL